MQIKHTSVCVHVLGRSICWVGVVNDSKKPFSFSFCVSGGSGSHPDHEQEQQECVNMLLTAGGWPADEQERFRERWTQEKLRSSVIHLLPEWRIMGVSRRNADQQVGKYKWIKPRSSSTNKHQTNSNYTRVKTAQNVISALQKTIRFSQAQKSKQSPKSPKLSFLCLTFQLVMCNYYNIMMFARQIWCVPETQLSNKHTQLQTLCKDIFSIFNQLNDWHQGI